MTVIRPPPQRPPSVHVAPLAVERGWAAFHGPAAIVFVADPDAATAGRQDQLRVLFGLTPMEAAVASRIAEGEGLKAAADHLGIAVTTARTHLQHVFEKTDTRRQSELVRLIAGSAAG
jgi:DNA-binding CsgD family transcriptional regulator